MATKSKNKSLADAKKNKQDEFYTQLSDIEKELRHYKEHFEGKTVLCNCDDPRVSNFFKYFVLNFKRLGLKKLIATCYKNQDADLFSMHDCEQAVYLVVDKDHLESLISKNDGYLTADCFPEIEALPLKGDGDFRSSECVELLKQADIVCTNPPFSLFRQYVAQLIEYDKKFLIIGNLNAITYKEIFPLISDNKMWLGYGFSGGNAFFKVNNAPSDEYANGVYDATTGLVKFRNCAWFTNLDFKKRHEELPLYKRYTPDEYPNYVNYDAIEVSKTKEIPADYDGLMGVPISFLEKYNPDQFEIIGYSREVATPIKNVAGPDDSYQQGGNAFYLRTGVHTLNRLYGRIVIKHKRGQNED